jgi:hypothetical protein
MTMTGATDVDGKRIAPTAVDALAALSVTEAADPAGARLVGSES